MTNDEREMAIAIAQGLLISIFVIRRSSLVIR
jgi:hypothetical protein